MNEKFKAKINTAIIICVAVYLVSLGIAVPSVRSQSDIDIALLFVSDPSRINRLTQLKVYIENNEDRELKPVFSIVTGEKHEKKGFWNIINGPDKLLSNEGDIFVLETNTPSYSIPYDTYFRVQVNDSRYPDFTATSETFEAPLFDFVGVQNPDLHLWQYKIPEGENVPFGWTISKWSEADEVLNFQRYEEDSVLLSVTNMTREKGSWAMVGLQQLVDLPHFLKVKVKPMFSASISSPRVTGVEISDGYKRIWIVFTDEVKNQVFFRKPSPSGDLEYAFLLAPVVIKEWNTVTVDIHGVYEKMKWQLPEEKDILRERVQYRIREVNLLAFVAVYPHGSEGADSLYEAYFDELTNLANP